MDNIKRDTPNLTQPRGSYEVIESREEKESEAKHLYKGKKT